MERLKKSIVLALLPLAMGLPVQAQETAITLEECRRMALAENLRLKAAAQQVEAARAAEKSAAAQALPVIDGSGMGIYLGPPLGGGMGGMIPEYIANAGLNASVPLYAGGRIRNGKAAAAIGTAISQEQLRMTTAEVLFATEKAYWQVVQVDEKVKLATTYRDMLGTLQRDLQNSFDAGLIFKNDLLRVQVSMNQAELGLREAQDGAALARMQLAQLIGAETSNGLAPADTTTSLAVPSALIDPQSAVENRPEIRTLTKVAEVEELKVKLLRGEHLPSLGLAASGASTWGKGVNLEDGSDQMFLYYGIASLSIPIFDWGKQHNKVKEQRYKAEAQRAQLEDTRQLIAMDVQNARLQLERSALAVPVSELSLQQSAENLRLANDRMDAGTITAKDVQEAQAIWQEAYSALIDARVDFRISEANYRKATGTIEW